MPKCPACAAPLESPVACGACQAVLPVPPGTTPFAVMGLEPGHEIDARELRRKLLRYSRLVHPDFFGNAEAATRERAEQNSALLNKAFETLSDDLRRADWLVVHRGGPREEEERSMPQAFLMEVMEWNETLEEAREQRVGSERVAELARELDRRRAAALEALRTHLVPLPAQGDARLRAARAQINALRYLDRALREIEALRLARAGGG